MGGAMTLMDEITDFEEQCAACGVNERVDGSRHCEPCKEALE